ncbi:MAG: hypothetical protein EA351_07570 [Gemmatimonadales bacterium]|nr:MAG: hypothetical protein EA351_07570 [Gemmatimonadales bacterium]
MRLRASLTSTTRLTVGMGVAALLLLGPVACEDVSVSEVEVASVSVSPGSVTLVPDESAQLSATPRDASGTALTGRSIEWSSASPQVATVDGSGLVRAVAPGTAQVRAEVGGGAGSATIQVSEPPQVVLSRSLVEFLLTAGTGSSDEVEVGITNGGGGTLSGLDWSISAVEGTGGWLEVSLTEGTAPSTLRLVADPGSLSPGRYQADVTVTGGGSGVTSATLRVVLEVDDAPPAIGVSPEAVGFASSEGQGAPGSQSVGVTNIGGGSLTGLELSIDYTAGGVSGWLTASLGSSSAPTELVLNVDPDGLEPGIYDAEVHVGSPVVEGEGSTVRVRYRFGEPPPQFELSPTVINRTIEEGDPSPGVIGVQISNGGSGEITEISAEVEFTGPTAGWAAVELVETTAPTQLLVSFDTDGILPGSYSAEALVESADAINSPASVILGLQVLARPDPETSTVTVDPDSITADGSSTSTVTVSLRDARGDLLTRGGDDVELTSSAGELSELVDLGDGRYRATLTASTSLETALLSVRLRGEAIADTAQVRFWPGEASLETSTLSASPTRITADGSSTSQITVRLLDAFNNPVGVGGAEVELSTTAGTLSAVTDREDGTYIATLTSSTNVEMAVVTALIDGEPLEDETSVRFIVGDVSAEMSTLEAEPLTITTDGSSEVRVQLRDAAGNDLTSGGDAIFLERSIGVLSPASGTTDDGGRFEATFTSAEPGTAEVTAYLGEDASGEVLGTVEIEIEPGEVSAEASTLEADPLSITTDGASELLVQLRDAAGNPPGTGGTEVFLATDFGELSPESGESDEDGRFASTLTSTEPGTATVTAYLGADATGEVIGTVTVEVEPGEAFAETSTVEANPLEITTDEESTVTIQLRDAAGNPLTTGGDEVFLSSNLGALSPAGGTTDDDGLFVSTFTSDSTGTATITAYLGTSAAEGDEIGTATVTIEPGDVSAEMSVVTADPTEITTDGESTVTVQLRDANGNDLTTDGDAVFLTTSIGELSPATGTSTNGQFTSTLTSTETGTATITAYLGTDAEGDLIGTVTIEVEDAEGLSRE